MMNDKILEQDVRDQINWEPGLNSHTIMVLVQEGVVTLSGVVDSYARKLLADHSARKVTGVDLLENLICVVIPQHDHAGDAVLTNAIRQAFLWDTFVPADRITVQVENGMVKLEGEVDWHYQRDAAANAIRNMPGIKVVLNAITLSYRLNQAGIRQQILKAFQRNAGIDAAGIDVKVAGTKVTLLGTVRSAAEKEEAERTAWQAPGITFAENQLRVRSTGTAS